MEREEAERRELQKMMMEGKDDKSKKDAAKQEEDPMASVVCTYGFVVSFISSEKVWGFNVSIIGYDWFVHCSLW